MAGALYATYPIQLMQQNLEILVMMLQHQQY